MVKNSVGFRVNIAKFLWEVVTRIRFWFTINKRDSHRAQNFFIPKMSCVILNTLPYDIFVVSASSLNFTLGLSNIISWIFSTFSGVLTSFGRPDRSASSVLVRPQRKSETTSVPFQTTEQTPNNIYQALLSFLKLFFHAKNNVLLTLEIHFFPYLQKSSTLLPFDRCQNKTVRDNCLKILMRSIYRSYFTNFTSDLQ